MTDIEINIAIAKAVGWKQATGRNGDYIARPNGSEVWHYDSRVNSYGPTNNWELLLQRKEIPSYTTDLNAMAEAEKALTCDQLYEFSERLEGVLDRAPRRFGNTMPWPAHKVTATAAQRAEAFLKTLGLWKD